MEIWPDDAVEVGSIADAYGLKGWVKIYAHAGPGHGSDALSNAKQWWLLIKDKLSEKRCAVDVRELKAHGGQDIVAHLAGIADRDAALALRGARIYVRRADFPALDDDEFYWVDLLGLDVINEAGIPLGQVAELMDNGVHSVLHVKYPTTAADGSPAMGERFIPFVGVYVKTVDRVAKRIVVDWQPDY